MAKFGTYSASSAEVHRVTGVTFGILRPDEIESMSATEIRHSNTYNENGIPKDGGINDLHMGTNDPTLRCKTCGGNTKDCIGHFGHIKLARPVYHFGFLNEIRRVLRCVCFRCSKLLIPRTDRRYSEISRIKNPKQRGRRLFKICDPINKCIGSVDKSEEQD